MKASANRKETPAVLARRHLKLIPAERKRIRSRLDDIDAAAPPSPEEKKLIDERVAAYRQNPAAGASWAVAEADIRKQLGL